MTIKSTQSKRGKKLSQREKSLSQSESIDSLEMYINEKSQRQKYLDSKKMKSVKRSKARRAKEERLYGI